jgi:hypothetical protein
VPDPVAPSTASPAAVPPVPSRKPNLITIAALAVVLLVVIGGIVIFSNGLGTTAQNTPITPVVTPVPTVMVTTLVPVPTPTETPEPVLTPVKAAGASIPDKGVWLRITYANKFSGTYGTPGNQNSVGSQNTGDQFFMIPTINGPVIASIQKLDGTSAELVIEVYKNGELIQHSTLVAPKGIIDLQVDLKPAVTSTMSQTMVPTITPEGTAALNSTMNASGTA